MKLTPKKQARADLLEEQWMMQYFELKKFKQEYGHCDVVGSPKNKKCYSLGRWCNTQRTVRKFSPLKYSPDRFKKLTELGFSWGIRDTWFENNFQQLKEYHAKYKHCNVRKSENKRLTEWCNTLRKENSMKVNSLTKERRRRLNELGFAWQGIPEFQWEKQFARLKEFKKKHGHCNVSRSRENNLYVNFSQWVATQRRYYHNKNKRLTPERIAKLDSISFNWINTSKRQRRRIVSDKDLIKELRRLNSVRGRLPAAKFIDEYGKYCAATYCSHFGSIGEARKAAGISSDTSYPKKYSDTELLDELKRLAKLLGREPTGKDVLKHGKYSLYPYYSRFDSFVEARKKAGLL